jgi:hypothetical protein
MQWKPLETCGAYSLAPCSPCQEAFLTKQLGEPRLVLPLIVGESGSAGYVVVVVQLKLMSALLQESTRSVVMNSARPFKGNDIPEESGPLS